MLTKKRHHLTVLVIGVLVVFELVISRTLSASFANYASTKPIKTRTARNGWRFDWMLLRKDGTGSLQTTDGYFLGELGFEKAQAAQGLRYRMRPFPEEVKKGIEVDGYITEVRIPFLNIPLKFRFGEMLGGTANNAKLRTLKKICATMPLPPAMVEENEWWLKRYGHKRWWPEYVDQTTGIEPDVGIMHGLGRWSGCDPLGEERGKTWIEPDYGKPLMAEKPPTWWLTKEQYDREMQSGIP